MSEIWYSNLGGYKDLGVQVIWNPGRMESGGRGGTLCIYKANDAAEEVMHQKKILYASY